jgi:hypothetical protein
MQATLVELLLWCQWIAWNQDRVIRTLIFIYKTNQKASQHANGSLILFLHMGISGVGREVTPWATQSKGRQNEDFKWKTSFSEFNKF